MPTRVIDGKVSRGGSLRWKSGRKISVRLWAVAEASNRTTMDIARLIAFNKVETIKCDHGNMIAFNKIETIKCDQMKIRRILQLVITGKYEKSKYIPAIEEAWRLPIDKIRQIYQEDKIWEKEWKERGSNEEELKKYRLAFVQWYKDHLDSNGIKFRRLD